MQRYEDEVEEPRSRRSHMLRHEWSSRGLPAILLVLLASPAGAQSFRVQCPSSTITHPNASANDSEPAYGGPTTQQVGANGYLEPTANVNGAIKCQQISGGDGYATMADGTQTYMFSFGPLSGLADIASGTVPPASPSRRRKLSTICQGATFMPAPP